MNFKLLKIDFHQSDVVKGDMTQTNVTKPKGSKTVNVEDVEEGKHWSAKELRSLYFKALMNVLGAGKDDKGVRTWKAVNFNLGRKFDVTIGFEEPGAPVFKAEQVSMQHLTKHMNELLKLLIIAREDLK